MKHLKLKSSALLLTVNTLILQSGIVYGADKGEVQRKITEALTVIQTILSSLIVIVGIVVTLGIIIKRLPHADNPHDKDEVYKALGRVWGLVALGAASIWLVPWVYSLFV